MPCKRRCQKNLKTRIKRNEECVAVTVRAIPGLKYALRRAGSLTAPVGEDADGTVWGVVDKPVVAPLGTVTLPLGGGYLV